MKICDSLSKALAYALATVVVSAAFSLAGAAVAWAQSDPAPHGPVVNPIPTPDNTGQVGMMIGSAGLLAVISAIAKDYWSDRKDAREWKLRERALAYKITNAEAVRRIYVWAQQVAKLPNIPPPPELPNDFDAERN